MTTILVIIAFICIPLVFIAGGFVAYKGVQLGLRWQIETKQEQQPTLNSTIQPIIEKVEEIKADKQEQQQASILSEWLHGEESR